MAVADPSKFFFSSRAVASCFFSISRSCDTAAAAVAATDSIAARALAPWRGSVKGVRKGGSKGVRKGGPRGVQRGPQAGSRMGSPYGSLTCCPLRRRRIVREIVHLIVSSNRLRNRQPNRSPVVYAAHLIVSETRRVSSAGI
eukprot:868763-Pyramimonas_sp.AAC.1